MEHKTARAESLGADSADGFGDAIAEYISGSVQLCEVMASDLEFRDTSKHGSLVIDGLAVSARFLRISVEEPNVLHLKSIEVMGGDERNPTDVAAHAKLSYSSLYPRTEGLAQRNLFIKHHTSEYAFHTGHDPFPWVQLQFAGLTPIRRVKVFNRTDAFAERAWKLRVETSVDGSTWQPIYSYSASEKSIDAALRHRRAHSLALLPASLKTTIDTVVSSAFVRDYARSVASLNALAGFKTSTKKEISAALNASLLLRRGVEWTNHDVKRTFRFWSPKEKSDYLNFAMKTAALLRDMSLDTCVGYGGVLAAIRGVDLIPHDDDIDLLILAPRKRFPNMAAFMGRVASSLSTAGYALTGDYAAHRHASKGSIGVDLFFGFEEDEFVSWLPGPRRVLRKEDVFPPLSSTFLGVDLALPHNPFKYVEVVYGRDWRTPIPGWNHKWDSSEYADWF